ncbi:MAG: DEAD/DEAH box helicase [Candidatus Diapherotrites archaeon]
MTPMEIVLEKNSFTEFNPMQKQVLKCNWKEKNLVISSPTASGKTIIAELFALNSIISKKKKVVYTCPLRALAFEHFNDFKKKIFKFENKSNYFHRGL